MVTSTTFYSRAQIEEALSPLDIIAAIEGAFVAYARGEAVAYPGVELIFDEPPGDCHIKYGYLNSGTTFTVKIATGFWNNPALGLPSSNGVVLVFSRQTGALLTILQDEGQLTNLRTAAAGAIAAKYLAPSTIDCIGIVGAGTQAMLQLDYLRHVTACRNVKLWARSAKRAAEIKVSGFNIEVVSSVKDVSRASQLIITTTASQEALLFADDVLPGTHITAVGADGGGKQELDAGLFALATVRAVDSISQCAHHGDASYALAAGLITLDDLTSLGEIIDGRAVGRQSQSDITIADLTGIAVQDIAIAQLALRMLERSHSNR